MKQTAAKRTSSTIGGSVRNHGTEDRGLMKQHLRDLLMLAAGALAAAVLLWSGLATRPAPASVLHGSVASLQGLAGFAASAAGLAIAVWWTLSLLLAVLAAVLHKAGHVAAAATAGAHSPAFMKRLAAAALGLNLVSALAPAHASDPQPAAGTVSLVSIHLEVPAAHAGTELPEAAVSPAAETTGSPHWKPRSPSPSVEPGPSAAPGPFAGTRQDSGGHGGPGENLLIRPGRMDTAPAAGQAIVRPGDSLWTLAADQLGPAATDAEIAAHWPRWYERNRRVIGDRPDLILPGQIFDIPEVPRS